jgi:hypothetical protein
VVSSQSSRSNLLFSNWGHLKACIASIAGETSTLLGMRKIIIGTDGITPFGKKGGKKGMTKVYSELSSEFFLLTKHQKQQKQSPIIHHQQQK